MARDETYREAEKKIEEAWRSGATALDLSSMKLTELPEALAQLHALLKEKDPSFSGLVRVRNKRQEFLWVHPQFEKEY
jgi:hypothetical protein